MSAFDPKADTRVWREIENMAPRTLTGGVILMAFGYSQFVMPYTPVWIDLLALGATVIGLSLVAFISYQRSDAARIERESRHRIQ